jgi:hypothetical protein
MVLLAGPARVCSWIDIARKFGIVRKIGTTKQRGSSGILSQLNRGRHKDVLKDHYEDRRIAVERSPQQKKIVKKVCIARDCRKIGTRKTKRDRQEYCTGTYKDCLKN